VTTEAASTVTASLAGARWWITRHALARWRERYAPVVAPEQAAAELAEVSRGAIDTGTETPRGGAIYMHPGHPTARFIVARERPGRLDALVTILDADVFVARDGRRRKKCRG